MFKSLSITESIQIVSLILAFLGSLMAIKTFKRNKTIELENQLYKSKLDSFAKIIVQMNEFSKILSNSIDIIESFDLLILSEEEKNKIDLMADEIDNQLSKCHELILYNSVYFSVESTTHLLQFSERIFDYENQYNDIPTEKILIEAKKYHTQQIELANTAIEVMRKEMALESLNTNLFKRIK